MSDTTNTLQPASDARSYDELIALPHDAILNPEEVRIYARLKSRQAVYNWLNDETDPLPASKKGGWRIAKSDLDAYLRKKHNRRESDQAVTQSTSDETLRRHLGHLIEISQAVIAWRRARLTFQAASDSVINPGAGGPDMEWIDKTLTDVTTTQERVYALSNSLSEESLTKLRFMLPSIHSDLALSSESAPAQTVESQTASPRRVQSKR